MLVDSVLAEALKGLYDEMCNDPETAPMDAQTLANKLAKIIDDQIRTGVVVIPGGTFNVQ